MKQSYNKQIMVLLCNWDLHSTDSRPNPDDQLPILMEENLPRDFFFPLSAREALLALRALPKRD